MVMLDMHSFHVQVSILLFNVVNTESLIRLLYHYILGEPVLRTEDHTRRLYHYIG